MMSVSLLDDIGWSFDWNSVNSDCNSLMPWAQYPGSTWDFVASIQRCILLPSFSLTTGFPFSQCILLFFGVYVAANGVWCLNSLGGILSDGMNGIFYKPKFNFRINFGLVLLFHISSFHYREMENWKVRESV